MKTIIPLRKNWRLAADQYQWILQKRATHKSKETKEPYDHWYNEGYFADIGSAVHECFQRSLRLSGLQSLKELEDYAKQLSKELNEALKPVVDLGDKK